MPIPNGSTVTLQCQGQGSWHFLDGDPNRGSVTLQGTSGGHKGTKWLVQAQPSGVVSLKCQGDGNDTYLDGNPNNGAVRLLAERDGHTGAFWELVKSDGTDTYNVVCQGTEGNKRFLDGDPASLSGGVMLQETTDGHAGTAWKVLVQ